VLLPPEGGVFGMVFDPDGKPRADIEVALTTGSGFRVTTTDANGAYKFENLNLGEWTVGAPAPPAVERMPGQAGDPFLNEVAELARSADPQALLRRCCSSRLKLSSAGGTR
jgi:hypothetical protein